MSHCVMTRTLCYIVFFFFFNLKEKSGSVFHSVEDDQLYTSNRGHCVTRSCVGDTLWGQCVHGKAWISAPFIPKCDFILP